MKRYVSKAYEKLNSKEDISCSCDNCANMCKHTPCMPTPEEANALIENGYGEKLALYALVSSVEKTRKGLTQTNVLGPAVKGLEKSTDIRESRLFGTCTFFENGLCTLHDKGLKPTEGRKVSCTKSNLDMRDLIVSTWEDSAGAEVKTRWENLIINKEDNDYANI